MENLQINYHVYVDKCQNNCFVLEMKIVGLALTQLELQLPAWRPGRYELQNFAKNIQQFSVTNQSLKELVFSKTTKDCWRIKKHISEDVWIKLVYFANVKNAGSSFVDKDVVYLNFVNFCPYIIGYKQINCGLTVSLPSVFKVGSGLKFSSKTSGNLIFYTSQTNWEALVDSPLLASEHLTFNKYNVDNIDFYTWFLGNFKPDWDKLIADFKLFSALQITEMGNFPEKEYHFINWILPYPYYHGVEHSNCTMIVMGPDQNHDQFDALGLYQDLLGVSSHELFHAWNICKIRPAELMPYDFTKENYFVTGFVVEGITTYLGDYFLVKSGVFTVEQYVKELETIVKRHFDNDDHSSLSLLESSYDLWLDGYTTTAVPNRRVSIYHKGALVTLALDLQIRLNHNHERSILTVMKTMWEHFGKTEIGYAYQDYKNIVESVYGDKLSNYFEFYIESNQPICEQLNNLLIQFGLEISFHEQSGHSLKIVDWENVNLNKWLY